MRMLIPLLVLVTACAPAPPTVVGRASVIDGDTLEIHGQRIRLWDVDAPEGRQSGEDASGAAYLVEETAARREKAGVWSGAFTMPEQWRRERRGGK